MSFKLIDFKDTKTAVINILHKFKKVGKNMSTLVTNLSI